MWADILSMCLGDDFRDIGSAQEVLGDRQEVFFVGRHKSIIADFDEAFWHDMLQEAVNKIKSRQRCCFPLIGLAVFKPESDLIVFEFFDAVVGNGDSVNVRRQIF